jgi:hypothetical protein
MEEGEALAWRDSGLSPQLLGYKVEEDVDRFWSAPLVGRKVDSPLQSQVKL